MPRTLKGPRWQQIWNLNTGRTQALLVPWRKGEPAAPRPAGSGFCPPAALTLPLLSLPNPPFTLAPDTRDLFKLCCKCNKPGPVPPLTRAGICPIPTLSRTFLETDHLVGRKCLCFLQLLSTGSQEYDPQQLWN